MDNVTQRESYPNLPVHNYYQIAKKKVFFNFFEDTKNYLCGLFQATPHLSSKRKSVNGRKLRPKSVVDSAEGLSADDIPDLLPSLPTSAEGKYDEYELKKKRKINMNFKYEKEKLI